MGAIAGGAIGAVVIIAALVTGVVCLVRRNKRKPQDLPEDGTGNGTSDDGGGANVEMRAVDAKKAKEKEKSKAESMKQSQARKAKEKKEVEVRPCAIAVLCGACADLPF